MILSEYIFRKNERRRDAIFCYLAVKSKLGSDAWQKFCTVSFKKQGWASYFCFHLECRDYTWEFYFSYYNFDLKSYLILWSRLKKHANQFSITKIGQKSNYYSYIFSIFSVPELIRGALQLIAYFLSRKGADIKFLHKNETPFLKCFIIVHTPSRFSEQKWSDAPVH